MLNPKQQRFVTEYLKDSNATQAAIRAGYSARTAGSQGHDLLRKPEISAAVAQHTAAAGVEAKTVLQELLWVGTADIAQAFATQADVEAKKATAVRELLHPVDMPVEFRRAIQGFEVETLYEGKGKDREAVGTLHKFRLAPKTDALDKLGRHLGIYKTDNEQLSKIADLVPKRKRAE